MLPNPVIAILKDIGGDILVGGAILITVTFYVAVFCGSLLVVRECLRRIAKPKAAHIIHSVSSTQPPGRGPALR
jgi:hypothetical protein